MTESSSVAVVGAGIAGLAAARTLQRHGIDFALLEASHRIGGRAYTEEPVPGLPFDLGCHWLHSASVNPLVRIADELGFYYDDSGWQIALFRDGSWLDASQAANFRARVESNETAVRSMRDRGLDLPLTDVIDRNGPWTSLIDTLIDYEVSLFTSLDSDQVSALDYGNAHDSGEDWPVQEGLGALVARYGKDVPVMLNAPVQRVDWSGKTVRLTTPQGTLEADKVLFTVSTGILGNGDIAFDPPLPDRKSEAIAALPLGNHNRIYLIFDRDVFGPDVPKHAAVFGDGLEPMEFQIQPFGRNYVQAMTGGRFADWLERAGTEASVDLAKDYLRRAFGSSITDHVSASLVTAWRGDPWIRGAYSAARPGKADQRGKLAEPVDDRLFFAGEAVSKEFFATAHGAYLSGIDVAGRLLD